MTLHKLLPVVCLGTFASPALAADDFNWNTAGPSDWNNAANWTNVNVGTGNNDRNVNNAGIATITSDGTVAIRDANIGRGGGSVGRVDNSAGTLSVNGWSFIGHDGGTGTYNLANTAATGGTYTNFGMGTGTLNDVPGDSRLYMGVNGGTGVMNINTTGTVHFGNDMYIGDGGNGTINIDNGTFNQGGGWGIIGGGTGTGNLRISGGTYNGWDTYLGINGGTGIMTMTGGIANLNVLRVGDNEGWHDTAGTGTVNITNGTINVANQMQVGRWGGKGFVNQSGGVVNVNAGWFGISNDSAGSAGSKYTLSGGDLNLNNGVNAEIGADTTGTMEVSGTGKLNGSNVVHVGLRNGGNGILNLSDSGEVNAVNGVSLGTNGGATGTLNGNGGTIFAPTIARGAGNAQFNANGVTFKARSNQTEFLPGLSASTVELQSGGLKVNSNGFDIATAVAFDGVGALTKQGSGNLTLNAITTHTGGTFVSGGTLTLSATGGLGGTGQIDIASGASLNASASGLSLLAGQNLTGKGSVAGNVNVGAGTLAPGNSIGTLTFANDLTLTSTSISNFEIIKLTLSDADLANVTGALTLAGTINVTSLGGTFANGDTFNLFDAATIAGNFATVNLPATTGTDYWVNNLGDRKSVV